MGKKLMIKFSYVVFSSDVAVEHKSADENVNNAKATKKMYYLKEQCCPNIVYVQLD